MDWNTAISWYVGLMLLTAVIVCLFCCAASMERMTKHANRKALAWVVLAVVNGALLAGWIAPQP